MCGLLACGIGGRALALACGIVGRALALANDFADVFFDGHCNLCTVHVVVW